VDPRTSMNTPAADFVPLLEHYKSLGARGVGEVTANLWWDDPRVQNLLAACEQTGLPLTFHIAVREFTMYGLIDVAGLYGMERALQKFPRLQLLGHSPGFWTEVSVPRSRAERNAYPKSKVLPGGRVPELMRKYDNLWGDLSAGSGCNAISRDPEWGYDFIEEFQDRLLMGMDLCLPSHDPKVFCLHFLREAHAAGKVSQQAFDKIMGENAVRLLGLDQE